tara:strand:+ start:318 stop:947 length:630 start_codon:yes stop_codon:yes gene_type:complete
MSEDYTPFKMKGNPMKRNFGISPAKHTSSRSTHMDTHGKGHTNADHPNYWKDKSNRTGNKHMELRNTKKSTSTTKEGKRGGYVTKVDHTKGGGSKLGYDTEVHKNKTNILGRTKQSHDVEFTGGGTRKASVSFGGGRGTKNKTVIKDAFGYDKKKYVRKKDKEGNVKRKKEVIVKDGRRIVTKTNRKGEERTTDRRTLKGILTGKGKKQ